MDRTQARREMSPVSGGYRLAGQEFAIEVKPGPQDYEPDWQAIEDSQQLWMIVQGWARK